MRTLYGTHYRCLESLKGIQQQASEEITKNHFELFFIYIYVYSGWIVWLHLTRWMHSIVGQALHCVASIACAIPMATISSKWLQSRTAAYTSQPLFPVLCSFFCSLQSLTFSSSPMSPIPVTTMHMQVHFTLHCCFSDTPCARQPSQPVQTCWQNDVHTQLWRVNKMICTI